MLKGSYHPKAFLSITRNVKPGLIARTRVLQFFETAGKSHTRAVVQKTGLTYASVLHHLHLLEAENILQRKGKRSYVWKLTGAGQQRLANVKNE